MAGDILTIDETQDLEFRRIGVRHCRIDIQGKLLELRVQEFDEIKLFEININFGHIPFGVMVTLLSINKSMRGRPPELLAGANASCLTGSLSAFAQVSARLGRFGLLQGFCDHLVPDHLPLTLNKARKKLLNESLIFHPLVTFCDKLQIVDHGYQSALFVSHPSASGFYHAMS